MLTVLVIKRARTRSLCDHKNQYEKVYQVMCPIQLKVIQIYVADPQKKDTWWHGKKEQEMRVGWCNEVLYSNTVEGALTSYANKLLAFVFLSKGFVFSFTCIKTIVKSHQMLIIWLCWGKTVYFPTLTLSAFWGNGERMLNEIWWALMNGERNGQTDANVREGWTHSKRYVNARLTVYSERLGSYPYIAFVNYQENVTYKLHVCIVITLNII